VKCWPFPHTARNADSIFTSLIFSNLIFANLIFANLIFTNLIRVILCLDEFLS
jgi:hypothetical protein